MMMSTKNQQNKNNIYYTFVYILYISLLCFYFLLPFIFIYSLILDLIYYLDTYIFKKIY